MSEEAVIKHCSPTLAGIKTGNLFSCGCPSRAALKQDIRNLNRALNPKGIRVLLMRTSDKRGLVYFYRPQRLSQDLAAEEAKEILQSRGYSCRSMEACLKQLVKKCREAEEFPHEIGLFLSYPCTDVKGFIEHRGSNCKCIGCWKVYGDDQSAEKQFARYKQCTEIYKKRWSQGASLQQLAVGS